MANIKQDIYILGHSQVQSLTSVGQEIRLDLQLQPQPLNQTGKLTGTVTDSNGNPVPNALVKIMDSSYNPLLHGITATDGTYTIDNVPAGTGYTVFATAAGMALNQGTTFTISAGQVITRNFTMVADPTTQLGIIAGDLYQYGSTTPINGAVVSLYSVNADETEVLVATTYTNAYGQFTFRELATGNYIVRISMLGYISSSSTVTIGTSGQIISVIAHLTVDTNASRGTVSGMITDNNNNGIAGADVVLYKVNADGSLTAVAFTKTNSAGVYLFMNVDQSQYIVKSNQTQDTII